jgi:hypothetical protein
MLSSSAPCLCFWAQLHCFFHSRIISSTSKLLSTKIIPTHYTFASMILCLYERRHSCWQEMLVHNTICHESMALSVLPDTVSRVDLLWISAFTSTCWALCRFSASIWTYWLLWIDAPTGAYRESLHPPQHKRRHWTPDQTPTGCVYLHSKSIHLQEHTDRVIASISESMHLHGHTQVLWNSASTWTY